MHANYRKNGILSRHAFTNKPDALGNAGMHNYQSELVTFGQRGKKKAVTIAYENKNSNQLYLKRLD